MTEQDLFRARGVMVTGYAPLGGPGETTVADGFTLLENPTGMSSIIQSRTSYLVVRTP